MSHLGDRVSALADGHLDPYERDRALAHVARCDACRREVDAERRARGVLGDLPDPAPSSRLLAQLRAIGAPPPPVAPSLAARDGASRQPMPSARRPAGGRPLDRADSRRPHRTRRSRSRGVRAAAAGALAVTAVSLGLAALGSATPGGTAPVAVVPPVQQFAVEHARSTGSLPFVESAVLVVPADEGTGQQ